jgi:hypothetical protein
MQNYTNDNGSIDQLLAHASELEQFKLSRAENVNRMAGELTPEIVRSLARLWQYIEEDEREDFAARAEDGANHIWHDVKAPGEWLATVK